MASFEAIVLNTGIAAAAPFSVGRIPKIAVSAPPTLVDSITAETVGGQWTIGTDPAPAATEKLRFLGGLISDTFVLGDNFLAGRGAIAPAALGMRNVVVGTLATVPAAGLGTENVVMGYNAALQSGIGSAVVIGAGTQQGPGFPANGVTVVGANNSFNNSFSGPGIGTGSNWQGAGTGVGNQQTTSAVNSWTIYGRAARANADNVTAIGDNARADHISAICLGRNSQSFGGNQFIAGAANLGIKTVLFGEGDTSPAPQALVFRMTDATGNNVGGGSLDFQASRGTGTGIGGNIRFRVGMVPAGAPGTLQTLTTPLELRAAAGSAADPMIRIVGADASGFSVPLLGAGAPSAGAPAVWVSFYFNGVVVAVPAWTV